MSAFWPILHVSFQEVLLQAARSHAREVSQMNQQLVQHEQNVQDLQAQVDTLQVGYLQHSKPHNCENGVYGVGCTCC